MFTRSAAVLTAVLSTTVGVSAAQAETLHQLDFTVTIDSRSFDYGPVNVGDEFYGNLVYDSDFLTGSGYEMLDPENGLNSLTLDIFGQTFTAGDDADYPDYPEIAFEDGIIDGINFLVELQGSNLQINDGDDEYAGTSFQANIGALDNSYAGTVTFDNAATVVPLPAAAWGGLAMLGLLGVGRTVKRRRSGETA